VDNLSDDFRRLWLVNLYNRRVNVGTVPIFSSILPEEQHPPDEQPTYPADPTCGMERECIT